MRTTVTIDDALVEKIKSITGTTNTSAMINDVMRNYVELEASRRLAALGGSMPEFSVPDDHHASDR